jgi:hypothetical protein
VQLAIIPDVQQPPGSAFVPAERVIAIKGEKHASADAPDAGQQPVG